MSQPVMTLTCLVPLFLATSLSVQAADKQPEEFKPEQNYKLASYVLKSHGKTLPITEYWSKVNRNEAVLRAGDLHTSWNQVGFKLSTSVVAAANKPPKSFREPVNQSIRWIPLLNPNVICTYDANNQKHTLSCKERSP